MREHSGAGCGITRKEAAKFDPETTVISICLCLVLLLLSPSFAAADKSRATAPDVSFDSLCAADAGIRIGRHVDGVAGYAIYPGDGEPSVEDIQEGNVSDAPALGGCFPCFKELIEDGYEYVEAFYVSAADRRDSPFVEKRDYYVSGTGLYRYRLIDRESDSEVCTAFDRMWQESERLIHADPTFVDTTLRRFAIEYVKYEKDIGNRCVSAERVDRFSARYRVGKSREEIELPDSSVVYRKRNFVERDDGVIIAEGVHYSLYLEPPKQRLAIADRRCGSLILPPLTDLLRPKPNTKRGE